jgi:hypothetical protein
MPVTDHRAYLPRVALNQCVYRFALGVLLSLWGYMCINITGVVDFTRGRKYCEAGRKYCEVSLVNADGWGLCGCFALILCGWRLFCSQFCGPFILVTALLVGL